MTQQWLLRPTGSYSVTACVVPSEDTGEVVIASRVERRKLHVMGLHGKVLVVGGL